MAKPILFVVAVLACFTGVGVSSAQVSVDSETCGGVFVSDPYPGRPRQSGGEWIRDFGITVLKMPSYVREEDFEYTCDVLEAVLPTMVEYVGDPIDLDTLIVEFDDVDIQHYSCWDNSITMSSIHADDDTGVDSGWDNLFIHELTHAFQGDLLCEGDIPSWFTEGMAEAARYFVGEAATEQSGRVVRRRRFDKRMAVYDMYNNPGEQILGGRGTIAYRFYPSLFDFFYQNAAGSVIVPALAQVAAGLDTPHPLARLTAELRAEKVKGLPFNLFDAVDRAWTAAVDGVMPPSRWVRRRAIACPSVRNGEFVLLIPQFLYNNVNSPWFRLVQFERVDGSVDYYLPTGDLHFVGVSDAVSKRVIEDVVPTVPDLDEGAYLVEMVADDQSGGTITVRTWMMNVNPALIHDGLWDGVAVVFVDGHGRPVNIAAGSLSFNGRLVTRVPGGVIAVPYDGGAGNLTFSIDGQVVGTVTATGPLPRFVALTVGDSPPPSVVSWEPYRPVKGEVLSVTFRRDLSSLTPGPGGSVTAILYDMWGDESATASMTASSVWPEVFTADLTIPGDLDHGVFAFTDGTSTHQGCRYWPCQWFWGYEFSTLESSAANVVRVEFDGTHLIAAFDGAVDTAPLLLRSASNVGDSLLSWTDHPDVTADQRGDEVRWNIRSLIGKGSYFRVVDTAQGGKALFTEFIAPAPTTVKLSPRQPFPNPGTDVVRWPFDVEAPTSATFGVYDVAGRRVFSSGAKPLYTGSEEFRWDSTAQGGRAPAGVYFLRVDGAGEVFTRKIVIVR